MTRRHGLFGPTTVRIVALLLALGMAAGVGAPYLIQAGVPVGLVVLLVLLVLGVPVIAILRNEKSRR